jgi:hypothetical protein
MKGLFTGLAAIQRSNGGHPVNNYVSSIVNKYGDAERVKQDTKAIFDILDRQGCALLIDALAEYSATVWHKFNLPYHEKDIGRTKLVDSLIDAINERI